MYRCKNIVLIAIWWFKSSLQYWHIWNRHVEKRTQTKFQGFWTTCKSWVNNVDFTSLTFKTSICMLKRVWACKTWFNLIFTSASEQQIWNLHAWKPTNTNFQCICSTWLKSCKTCILLIWTSISLSNNVKAWNSLFEHQIHQFDNEFTFFIKFEQTAFLESPCSKTSKSQILGFLDNLSNLS